MSARQMQCCKAATQLHDADVVGGFAGEAAVPGRSLHASHGYLTSGGEPHLDHPARHPAGQCLLQ